jgi:threonine aldolase
MALREGPALLAHDHERAQRLARGLAELRFLAVDPVAVETNIVMADLRSGEPAALLSHLQRQGVLAATAGSARIRFVLHRDVDDVMVQRCLDACRTFVPAASTTPPS